MCAYNIGDIERKVVAPVRVHSLINTLSAVNIAVKREVSASIMQDTQNADAPRDRAI